MEISTLRQIGLTEGETRIYEALLELGETTRKELARKSGISPSKIYDVVDRLVEKGLVAMVRKEGVLHFSPANPHRLFDLIAKKEGEINSEKALVKKMIPLLMMKYTNKKERTDIEVFYGWEGMKSVYNDIIEDLQKGDFNYIFGASKGEEIKLADIFFFQHFKKVSKKGIKLKIIFNENLRGYNPRIGYYSHPHEIRFLHQDTFTEMNLHGNTVLIVMLLKKPIVIRIRNKEAADSFKKFFDTIWKQAKK